MKDLILVLDAGTGGGRAVAVGKDGRAAARSYRAWSYFEPPGLELYGKEFSPREFESLLAECCRDVVNETGTERIAGMVTTGMRQGCVFLDGEGVPVYGGPNRDVRGILFTEEVEKALGRERAYNTTGRWPPWMFIPSRLWWFREERPDVFKRVKKVLMINDWLVHWLCGKAASEPTNAAESMLFDIEKGDWSEELVAASGLLKEALPQVKECGTVVGEVSNEVSAATGIPEGTPVIAGMADTQAALLAGGVVVPGQAGVVAGSTAPVMIAMDSPKIDPAGRLWTGCHAVPGLWLAESNSGEAGISYRGYVEGHLGFMAEKGKTAYDKVEELAEEAGTGAFGAIANLGPVIWDLEGMSPSVRGGLTLSYPLSPDTAGPGAVARALLENIAFAIRANLEQASVLAGKPDELVLTGGMTRTKLFSEIVANVANLPVKVVREYEATAIGAAMAGFFGLNEYTSLRNAAKELPVSFDKIEPDEDDADDYDDIYDQWIEQYGRMMGGQDL